MVAAVTEVRVGGFLLVSGGEYVAGEPPADVVALGLRDYKSGFRV